MKTNVLLIVAILGAGCADDEPMPDLSEIIEDASVFVDAAEPPDMTDTADYGDLASFEIVQDCGPGDYLDETGVGASRLVQPWDTSLGKKCLKIKVGQTVIWSPAPSNSHPLEGAGGSANSPISADMSTPLLPMIMFPTEGIYGYHCVNHQTLQYGAIWVVP